MDVGDAPSDHASWEHNRNKQFSRVAFSRLQFVASLLGQHLLLAQQSLGASVNSPARWDICRVECYPWLPGSDEMRVNAIANAQRNTDATMETSTRNSVLVNSVLVILLSILFLPKSQAEEFNHQEMVCALTAKCAAPFADRRLRGITSPVAPRPPLSIRSLLF